MLHVKSTQAFCLTISSQKFGHVKSCCEILALFSDHIINITKN